MEPPTKTQIKQIKQVQRSAARFVLKKPFKHQNPTIVTSMLSELKWLTFEQRRSSFDLIFMYKIVQQLVAVPINYLLVPSPRYNKDDAVYICNTNLSARNSMKFVTYHCNINAYINIHSSRELPFYGINYQKPHYGKVRLMASMRWYIPLQKCVSLPETMYSVNTCWTFF